MDEDRERSSAPVETLGLPFEAMTSYELLKEGKLL